MDDLPGTCDQHPGLVHGKDESSRDYLCVNWTPLDLYRKCECGCGAAVSLEYWRSDVNADHTCFHCKYPISVHTRHDLIACARR